MYAAPVGLPGPGVNKSAATALPLVAIACLGVLGFLVAAAIILALIPIYVPNTSKQATLKQSQTSKITFLVANSPTKRQTYTRGVEDLYGATMTSSGLTTIGSRLLAVMGRSKVSNCIVKSALLSYQSDCGTGRKKRFSIAKRQTYCPILIVEYYVLYQFDCFFECQVAAEPTLRNSLLGIGTSFAPLTNVGFILPDGSSGFRNSLNFQEVYAVDPIVPVHTGVTINAAEATLVTVGPPSTTTSVSNTIAPG